jgi:ribonuclease P protein component
VIDTISEPALTGSFSKIDRFLSKYDYRAMKSGSKRLVGRCLCVDFKPALKGRTHSRLGITASGKFGSSVERNRFKRLVREAFRTKRQLWNPQEIHIVPRQLAKSAKFCDIANELIHLLKQK